jgi:hypothetical protein
MHKLEDTICYLIGAIDAATDQGCVWRQQIRQKSKAALLDIKYLDPTNKVAALKSEVMEEHDKVKKFKSNGKWDELSSFMETIVRQDHRCVDLSDFVIFYLDPSVHTCGSYFEFQSALTEKKPYFIIVPGGKANTPSWLFGICDHNNIYGTIDEVVDHLVALDSGTEKMSDRWVIFRKEINDL